MFLVFGRLGPGGGLERPRGLILAPLGLGNGFLDGGRHFGKFAKNAQRIQVSGV